MKTLNLKQMEVIEGGKPCTEEQVFFMLGAGAFLTIATGGLGAWLTAGALYSCVLKSN